jgi:hypothetical protein
MEGFPLAILHPPSILSHPGGLQNAGLAWRFSNSKWPQCSNAVSIQAESHLFAEGNAFIHILAQTG